MISLFALEERDVKRQRLNDPPVLLARHTDFDAIAAALDTWLTLGSSGRPSAVPDRGDGQTAAVAAVVQPVR
jgi:hypothetical protein